MDITVQGKNDTFTKAAIKSVNERVWSIQDRGAGLPKIPAGKPVTIVFIRAGDAEYRLSTQVLESQGDHLVLDHTDNLKRKQLRNWVRVDVNIPCKAILTEKVLVKSNGEGETEIPRGTAMNGP